MLEARQLLPFFCVWNTCRFQTQHYYFLPYTYGWCIFFLARRWYFRSMGCWDCSAYKSSPGRTHFVNRTPDKVLSYQVPIMCNLLRSFSRSQRIVIRSGIPEWHLVGSREYCEVFMPWSANVVGQKTMSVSIRLPAVVPLMYLSLSGEIIILAVFEAIKWAQRTIPRLFSMLISFSGVWIQLILLCFSLKFWPCHQQYCVLFLASFLRSDGPD